MKRLLIILAALVLLAAIFMLYSVDTREAVAPATPSEPVVENAYPERLVYRLDPETSVAALERDCTQRGGFFNECGSPCAPEAEVCATVCAYTCDLALPPLPPAPMDMGTPTPFTAETAELTAVGSSTGEGIATREWDGAAFVHTVTAKLIDPPPGMFYEGWLVRTGGAAGFISTGKLSRSGGGYALTYTEAKDRSDHPQVVVTLETAADRKPELHVLEGTFIMSE